MKKETPEHYFLKYAYPCAFILVKAGQITKKQAEDLENNLLDKGKINRADLEKIFTAAFRRIKKLAASMHKDYWDILVLKEYWCNGFHNKMINEKEGNYKYQTAEFKDLCRIHKAEVIGRKGNYLSVEYGSKKRKVSSILVPNAKKGEVVTIHFNYAVEKI